MTASYKVLFFVEGFTDIRFVLGLSEICDLTLAVPTIQYQESGLKQRVAHSGARLQVDEIAGGRLQFQLNSLSYLWRRAPDFDLIVSQEMLRGSFNATLIGRLRNIPVITYLGIAPLEYFRCRRERRQIGTLKSFLGTSVIQFLLYSNGLMATRCLAMGSYLRDVAARYCARSAVGLYYGVDTAFFCPASDDEIRQLRQRRNLPLDKFIIFLSSRISHEKDPETVLRATALARERGLDAVVINLGGGYQDFLNLAKQLQLPNSDEWVLGRPAAHPMTEVADYFRAADVMALASLAEGLGYSTLEALSCGTPVVATAVGGMAVHLQGRAHLTPRRDPEAMCQAFLWIANNRAAARAQALAGREYVVREWRREKAFGDLLQVFKEVCPKKLV
jgi:glycosyltransferase involved in cell wall biosynthesis